MGYFVRSIQKAAQRMADVFLENIDDILKIREEVGSPEDVSPADFIWSERDRSRGQRNNR